MVKRTYPNDLLNKIWAYADTHLDWDELKRIDAAHRNGSERKYLDTHRWLKMKLDIALDFELEKKRPSRVLDLGTGPGHFPYVTSFLGHEVVALDQPGIPIYDDLCAWLGIEKLDWAIRPSEPLPKFEGRFDMVTALMLGFNTRPDGKLFTIEEWGYFLDDIRSNILADNGILHLKMIRQQNREGLKISDPELQDYFKSRGAEIDLRPRYVSFTAAALRGV